MIKIYQYNLVLEICYMLFVAKITHIDSIYAPILKKVIRNFFYFDVTKQFISPITH